MNTTQAVNGEIQVSDYVITVPQSNFGCYIGVVTAINKQGTLDHVTGNPHDDVHVNYLIGDYSPDRMFEIEDDFRHLGKAYVEYETLPIKDIVMAPDSLISLTGIAPDIFESIVDSKDAAEKYCNMVIDNMDWAKKNLNIAMRVEASETQKNELMERLTKNYDDFMADVMKKDKNGIIGMVREIAATTDAHYYLTESHDFKAWEAEYLLNFQNPLEVVSDAWLRRQDDISDMSFAIDSVLARSDSERSSYALMSDPGQRRYLDVDLIAFMGAIAEKVVTENPIDWNLDKEVLERVEDSIMTNPGRRLLWGVGANGTVLEPESNVFIEINAAHGNWVNFHSGDDVTFGYAITVTSNGYGSTVIGNVFELGDAAEHAEYVRRSALPDAADITALNKILQRDFSKRGLLPIESTEDHLQWLTETLAELRNPPEAAPPAQSAEAIEPPTANPIQAEARRITDEFLKLTEPNSPNKTHFMVKLSPDFIFNASTKDQERLLRAIPVKNLSLSNLKGEKGIFAFASKGKNGKIELKRSKASVLGDLAAKTQEVKARPAPDAKPPDKKNPDIS